MKAPIRDSGCGQPLSAQGGQPQTLQKPGTSGTHQEQGLSSVGLKTPESKRRPQGPGKRQLSTGGTRGGGRAKKPKRIGQLGHAGATVEGLRVAVVNGDYPGSQISRDDFVNIQRAIGRLVDELPDEGFTPRLVDSYWARGRPLSSARMNQPEIGWQPGCPPWRLGRAPGSR